MKLSVIVPVYNVAPWLQACLSSVLRALEVLPAEGGGTELVCVDDGSTDGSSALLDALEARAAAGGCGRTAVRVLRQANAGVSAARNAALGVVTGEWVAFVDGDDEVEPDWFAKLLALAGEAVDLVHANARYCFRDPLGEGRPGETRTVDNPCRLFLREGWSVLNLVRRSVIGPVRYRAGMRFKEDVIFFAELANRSALRVVAANLRGYAYRARAGSAVAQVVREEDCRRFYEEVVRLGLPREEAGRAVGFDLALWVKGRDRSRPYEPATCPVLALWREGVARGVLNPSADVRFWWRPGLRRWLATGDLSLLELTCRLRLLGERLLRRTRG